MSAYDISCMLDIKVTVYMAFTGMSGNNQVVEHAIRVS